MGLSGLGIFDLSKATWKDVEWWVSLLENDGWEILAIKYYPKEGIFLFAKEVIIDFLDDDVTLST